MARLLASMCGRCVCGIVCYMAFVAMWRELQTISPCAASVGARQSYGGPSAGPLVPKIIHQQWKTARNVPDDPSQGFYHKRWKEVFPEPEYEHRLWTDLSARALIKDHFGWF